MGASPYLSHLPLADVSSTLAKSTTPAVAGSMRRIPGVASRGSLRLPRAVFWRPFRALIPIANQQRPPWRAQCAAFPGLLPGGRYAYPGLCSGALSGRSFPSPIDNARRGGRLSPSHVINARAAGVFPPRHLWRGGGRQAGGEVIPLSRVQASRSRNRAPFSCRS